MRRVSGALKFCMHARARTCAVSDKRVNPVTHGHPKGRQVEGRVVQETCVRPAMHELHIAILWQYESAQESTCACGKVSERRGDPRIGVCTRRGCEV